MMFKKAGQPELIRSNQKDVFYVNYLRESVGQIFREFAGVYSWIKWKDELELLAEVCYLGLTTISGFQTLGEEYCNIVQVDKTSQDIPTTLSRCMLVFVQAVIPYLMKKVTTKLSMISQSPDTWPRGLTERSRLWLLNVLPVLNQAVIFVHRAHLTLFYLNGLFYHISKRITSINYILVRSGLKDISSRPTYRLLGYISALQLVLSLLFSAYKSRYSNVSLAQPSLESESNNDSSVKKQQNKQMKCSLCLESLHDVTATPCGHLFDWYCIAEWCSNKQECPLCREPVQLSRLVCLHHFDCT